MKKMLKWVLPAVLGIVPVMGMQDQPGMITDPFFTNATCSIRMVVESGASVQALVDATAGNGTAQSKLIEPLCATLGWQNNDDELFSQEKINAQVICGSQFLQKEHTKALKVPYKLVNSTITNLLADQVIMTDMDLPLGIKVDVVEKKKYTRPDTTECESSTILHHVMAVAMLDDDVVPEEELLNLAGGTILNVFKNTYAANTDNLTDRILIYKLLVKEQRSSRNAWVTISSEEVSIQGKLFSKAGSKRTEYVPQNHTLTDAWKEVRKKLLTDTDEVEGLLFKKGVVTKTKKPLEMGNRGPDNHGYYHDYTTIK